jgi:hypothetical protein
MPLFLYALRTGSSASAPAGAPFSSVFDSSGLGAPSPFAAPGCRLPLSLTFLTFFLTSGGG